MKNKIIYLGLSILTFTTILTSSVFANSSALKNSFNSGNDLVNYYNIPKAQGEEYKLEDFDIYFLEPTTKINDNSSKITMIASSSINKVYSKDYIIKASTHARYKDELRTVDNIGVTGSFYEKDKEQDNWDYSFSVDEKRTNAADVQKEKTLVFPEKYMRLFSTHTIETKNYEKMKLERDIEQKRSWF